MNKTDAIRKTNKKLQLNDKLNLIWNPESHSDISKMHHKKDLFHCKRFNIANLKYLNKPLSCNYIFNPNYFNYLKIFFKARQNVYVIYMI